MFLVMLTFLSLLFAAFKRRNLGELTWITSYTSDQYTPIEKVCHRPACSCKLREQFLTAFDVIMNIGGYGSKADTFSVDK